MKKVKLVYEPDFYTVKFLNNKTVWGLIDLEYSMAIFYDILDAFAFIDHYGYELIREKCVMPDDN